MPNIALTTEEIYSYANELKSIVDDMRVTLNDIQIVIDDIPTSWIGDAAETYREKLTLSKNNVLMPLINYFGLAADKLNETGVKVEETQSNIKQKIVNLGMISTSAAGALSGSYVSQKSLSKSVWDDTDNLSYKDRGDGTYQIIRNGEVIGYTNADNIVGGNNNSGINQNIIFKNSQINDRMNYVSDRSSLDEETTSYKPPIGGIEYTRDNTSASVKMADTNVNTNLYDIQDRLKVDSRNVRDKGYPSSQNSGAQPTIRTAEGNLSDNGYPSSQNSGAQPIIRTAEGNLSDNGYPSAQNSGAQPMYNPESVQRAAVDVNVNLYDIQDKLKNS